MALIEGLALHYDRQTAPWLRPMMEAARRVNDAAPAPSFDTWRLAVGAALLGSTDGTGVRLDAPGGWSGPRALRLIGPSGKSLNLDSEETKSIIRDSWVLKNFEDSGRRVFYIAPDLTRALQHTDFRAFGRDVRLPFDTVYYVLSGSGIILEHSDGTRHPLEGMYVRIGDEAIYGTVDSLIAGTPTSRSITILAIGSSGEAGKADNVARFCVGWSDDEEHTSEGLALSKPQGIPPATLLQLARLAVNVSLYLSSPDAETRAVAAPRSKVNGEASKTKSPKKRAKRERRASRLGSLSFILVGESLRFTTDGSGIGKKLGFRFMVRGHWRHQPWGPRRTFKRWRWIQPHWKGPDAVTVLKPYFVAGEAVRRIGGVTPD